MHRFRVKKYLYRCLAMLLLLLSCALHMREKKPQYDYNRMDKNTAQVHKKIVAWLDGCLATRQPVALPLNARLDSVCVDKEKSLISVYFNKPFSFPAWRLQQVSAVYAGIRDGLGRKYKKFKLGVFTLRQPLEQLVPNYYRSDSRYYDRTRMPAPAKTSRAAVVRPAHPLFSPRKGLLDRVIDVRPSHGWYYSVEQQRWEWQRPRMFQTVEDLLNWSIVVPYLIPMLENAGATVFMPRERDRQIHEVIVDNENNQDYSERAGSGLNWTTAPEKGFALITPPFLPSVNPFLQGSSRRTLSDSVAGCTAQWVPDIPQTGEYSVYVTFQASEEHVDDAHYTVRHGGGETELLVNQQVAGHTWIHLGRWKFTKGRNPLTGSVTLSNKSRQTGRWISADAVRFGGGMSLAERDGIASGRPRFCEGSKYYLHYLGFPDTLIHNTYQGHDDYRDDYVSRSEYANYISGAPFGPKKNRMIPGLGMPVDLSLALHTDAGITHSDTTIGTLAIYSVEGADSQFVFPNAVSRMANRDLADILQTQLTMDLSRLWDAKWNRRHLMDAGYAEAVRPNMPSTLIELLSHQNFLDMTFALDPRFRFDAARALYKGMLRFLAVQHQQPYQVQPLPVTHFQALFSGPREVLISWQPGLDSLEASAKPDRYIVYTRKNDSGFDNGVLTTEPRLLVRNLTPGVIYSFQVRAANDGGAGFASEILAVCFMENDKKPLLIVNGFDRVCGPATIQTPTFSGFAPFLDPGVADHFTMNYTGQQIDFDPNSAFRSNDAPGHGASQANYETQVLSGNTFDFVYTHGCAIKAAGYSFVSCSDEAVMDGLLPLGSYPLVDIIFGEEKETSWPNAKLDSLRGKAFKAWPGALQAKITAYLRNGGNLLVSGAYWSGDLCKGKKTGDVDFDFSEKVLRCRWTTDHSAVGGEVTAVEPGFLPHLAVIKFNTIPNDSLYAVKAPDAINACEGGRTLLRYTENQFSAAVGYKKEYGVVAMGFPFETILGETDRRRVLEAVLRYLAL